MQNLVPRWLEFSVRPAWGIFLRLLGVTALAAGFLMAVLDATFAEVTPVLLFLGAIAAFLGVVCNELSQIIIWLQDRDRR